MLQFNLELQLLPWQLWCTSGWQAALRAQEGGQQGRLRRVPVTMPSRIQFGNYGTAWEQQGTQSPGASPRGSVLCPIKGTHPD